MTNRHLLLRYSLASIVLLSGSLSAATKPLQAKHVPPHLLPNAPTFNLTISQFEQAYNAVNPNYAIPTYRQAKSLTNRNSLYFYSKISDSIYSSVVLDRQNSRIKSLQLTYVSSKAKPANKLATAEIGALLRANVSQSNSIRVSGTINDFAVTGGNNIVIGDSDAIAIDYMISLFQWFNPSMAKEHCEREIARLIKAKKYGPFYAENDSKLRYVIVDRGEKGITLAIEPIKPTTSKE